MFLRFETLEADWTFIKCFVLVTRSACCEMRRTFAFDVWCSITRCTIKARKTSAGCYQDDRMVNRVGAEICGGVFIRQLFTKIMDYKSLLSIIYSSEKGSEQELKSEFHLSEGWTGVTPIAELIAFFWHSTDDVDLESRLDQELFQFLLFAVSANVHDPVVCSFSC